MFVGKLRTLRSRFTTSFANLSTSTVLRSDRKQVEVFFYRPRAMILAREMPQLLGISFQGPHHFFVHQIIAPSAAMMNCAVA